MNRPCFLVIDREFPGSISTRKLVLETAKFNVITAYTGREAREMFARFPAISGVVMDAGLDDIPCAALIAEFKAKQPKLPVVVVGTPDEMDCPGADYRIPSFQPAVLLETLLVIKPEASWEIEQNEERLSKEK
ncbi:MAG TPA: response regulator [Granulicella sp.]